MMTLEIVNVEELSIALITVSAIVMVLVNMLKSGVTAIKHSKNLKYAVSILLSIVITLATGITLFETDGGVTYIVGAVAAGLIASLGSNFIHEIMKVLQTFKELKSTGKEYKRK